MVYVVEYNFFSYREARVWSKDSGILGRMCCGQLVVAVAASKELEKIVEKALGT